MIMKTKKILSTFISLILCTSYCNFFTAHATTSDKISVVINGYPLKFEVDPQIINDCTMVPMRAIFESLGYKVSWNAVSKEINAYRGQQAITLNIDSKSYKNFNMNVLTQDVLTAKYMEDAEGLFEVAPTIINGNTLVPVRAISELSGCTVNWNGVTRTVEVTGYIPSKSDILKSIIKQNGSPNYDKTEYTVFYATIREKYDADFRLIYNTINNKAFIQLSTSTLTLKIEINDDTTKPFEFALDNSSLVTGTITTDWNTYLGFGTKFSSAIERYPASLANDIRDYIYFMFKFFDMYLAENYIFLYVTEDFGVVFPPSED